MKYRTEQEEFWSTDFGSEYLQRNKSAELKASCINQFNLILSKIPTVKSITEFGSNIGNNIEAIHSINSDIDLTAIEINKEAADILSEKKICKVINKSVLDLEIDHQSDLTFTSGVLIHIHPDQLNNFYEKLYKASGSYILIIEYYNPTPVTVDYRGHKEKLFKRDFAGEIIDLYPDLTLIDYGFFYDRDPRYPTGANTNWFLLKKAVEPLPNTER